jgi:hypothetical protein
MEKVYYEKIGDEFVPISSYDPSFMAAKPKGKHLIMEINPGSTSYMYNVDPAFVPVLAAAKYAESALSNAIVRASDLKLPSKLSKDRKLTPEQNEAWQHLVEVFGDEAKMLEWPSARGAAEEVIATLAKEAYKMLTVPAVKLAYDQFMLVYKLTKDEIDESNS